MRYETTYETSAPNNVAHCSPPFRTAAPQLSEGWRRFAAKPVKQFDLITI